MFNPYVNHGASLTTPARRVILIAPSDADALPQVCKGLRIWNPGVAVAHVALVTDGGDSVSLAVPAGALIVERVVTTKVLLTGTDAGLVIHGYTD